MLRRVFKPYLLTLGPCTESWGFFRSCCIIYTSICQFKLGRQMSSGANDPAFRDHGWGRVAVYPRWPHVLLTKLFQPFHNSAIPKVKELSEIFWRKIRALTDNLRQFILSFKPHAPLQRFARCVADLVLQLLKPSLNYPLAKSLTRKIWIRF